MEDLDRTEEEATDTEKSPSEAARVKAQSVGVLICALLIAAAAGAAAMSIKLSDDTAEPKIYYDRDVSSTVTAETKTSAVTEGKAVSGETVTADVAVIYSFPADINTADEECLSSVNGINRNVAEEIVRYREKRGKIRDLNELLDVYGVGERTLSVIKEHFYISEEDRIPLTTTVSVKMTAPVKTTVPRVTTEKPKTSRAAKTTTSEMTTSEVTATAPVMRRVNINKTDASELAEALLIKPELAEAIVELREKIGAFVNDLELLYVDGFSETMLVERREYIIIS